jgi:ParB family chromosome partitioning protein
MEKKALGRGLSALISSGNHIEEVLRKEIPFESGANPEKGVLYVEMHKLVPNKFQPRQDFNEDQLKELVASVKEKGVLAPILARKIGDKYEIIAGERRFRAACQLKLDRIPVVIRNVDDKEALVLSIVENIQRQELNAMEEAKAFQRLVNEFSLTQEAIAQAVSKDRTTVANTLRLLNLPLEIQKMISSGRLSFGHGKALLSLDNIPQQIKLTQLVLSKSLSVRELETYIQSHNVTSLKKKKIAKDKDPYVADLENQLQKVFGTKVKIFAFKKRGKIEIEYYSNEDRERILKILKRG